VVAHPLERLVRAQLDERGRAGILRAEHAHVGKIEIDVGSDRETARKQDSECPAEQTHARTAHSHIIEDSDLADG
jgi:hypothetical protein